MVPDRGRIALVGSGEWTPATEAVDRALLDERDGPVVILPTAAGREGSERVAYWIELGRAHYRRLGIEPTALLVLGRGDAEEADTAVQVEAARLVYLSGGDPTHLARSLVGTRVGDAIRRAWLNGAAVAGCSAGAMALMETVPDIRDRSHPGVPGLGLVSGMRVMPHFDQLERWAPGATRWAIDATPEGAHLVGIDEETAIIGDSDQWTVMGRGAAWVLGGAAGPVSYREGETLRLG